jgi:2-haloacid dehalogenase
MSDRSTTVATFDCYGTLVDWEGGAGSFLYQLARRSGYGDPPPARVLRDGWERIQFEVIAEPYRRYADVLAESLGRWARVRGYAVGEHEAADFVDSMRSWGPFPDTRPALLRARAAGLRLVIVSNTDRDIMSHTLRQLDVPFDEVVVAEDVGAYKPSRRVFDHAIARIGEDPARMLHVAFGFEYDIGPAQQAGMRTAWVNRHAAPLGSGAVRPDLEWRDLWPLAELAEASASSDGPR